MSPCGMRMARVQFGGITAVLWAAVISLVAHFAVGAAKTLVTGRSPWVSGMEMTVVGAVEGAITYGLGLLFGGVAGCGKRGDYSNSVEMLCS